MGKPKFYLSIIMWLGQWGMWSNLVGARRFPHSLSIGYRLLYHEIT